MKKLCLGVPVLNCQKETIEFLDKVLNTANFLDEVIIIDNGSYPTIRSVTSKFFKRFDNKIKIIRFDHNIGVRPALNEIWKNTEADIIVYTHNDVDFFENGWDEKVRKAFDEIDNVGIVGAYGAKGLGSQDIYKTDYKMSQLARSVCVSDCPMDMEVHGFRNLENSYENVAVFDGFFMAIKKELLDKTGGFSDILPTHHNYDNLICIESLKLGYENIVIPLGIQHRGGMTDVSQDWTKGLGKTKQEVHAESHPPLYEHLRGVLPVYIEDIYREDYSICGYTLYMNNELIKTKIYE